MNEDTSLVKTIVLDNEVECFLLEEISNGKDIYYFLANTTDPSDLYIRKNEVIDGEEYLVTLDSQEELEFALNLFKDKHQS